MRTRGLHNTVTLVLSMFVCLFRSLFFLYFFDQDRFSLWTKTHDTIQFGLKLKESPCLCLLNAVITGMSPHT